MAFVTIRDVAKHAGISVSTVSRALNNSGRIAPSTKAKVQQAAQELGYIPDSRAQAMRSSRTKTIGLLVPDIRNAYFAELAYAVQDTLFDAGYCTFIGTSSENATRQDAFIASILSQRIDGAIIVPQGGASESLQTLLRQHLPLMFLDRHVDLALDGAQQVPVVDSDPAIGLAKALLDIRQHGFSRVGYVAGPVISSPSLQEREQTFRKLASQMFGGEHVFVESTDFQQASCESMLARMLNVGVKALIFGYSPDAVHAMKVMDLQGLQVGKDISIVSFDNLELFRLVNPRISVISQQVQRLGCTGATMFLDLLERGRAIRSERVETLYIPRESVGLAK